MRMPDSTRGSATDARQRKGILQWRRQLPVPAAHETMSQVTSEVVVWDLESQPPGNEEVLSWRSHVSTASTRSIPRYLEDHAERLRAKYLAFIHDLGESRIDGRRVVDHLDMGDGFSLWWMTHLAVKSPFKSPRIYDCLRLLALEEMLLNGRPSHLTLRTADRELAWAIERLCRNLRVAFAWQASRRKWSLRGFWRELPYGLQALTSLRHILRWQSGERAVLFCSYFMHLDEAACASGRFRTRFWESLPEHLHASGIRTNWIQIFSFSAAIQDLRTALAWVRQFNRDSGRQGCHVFLETYLTMGLVIKGLIRWLRLAVAAWRLRQVRREFSTKGSGVWLWPILRRDWQISLAGPVGLQNCLESVLFDAVLRDLPKQRRGLYLCENLGWERAFLHAWRKHGHGEIIGVPHSTVPFWHLTYFADPRSLDAGYAGAMPMPDKLAVNGPMAWTAFAGTGYPPGKLVKVEALRYQHLVTATVCDSREKDMRSPQQKAAGCRVLAVGDMVPETMGHFLSLLEGARQRLPPGYLFTFKPHSGYVPDCNACPGLRVTMTDALDKLLKDHDVVFAANSTTASVEAYLAGLPVIVALDEMGLNLSPLRGHPGVRFVSRPEELAEALQLADSLKVNRQEQDFFFLDDKLPAWDKLLASA
jgi:surface carbohydrate biosynthesis protein (TIGR04326 family)